MLYITTRNHSEVYSEESVLRTGIAPDGGLFVPQTLPAFTRDEIISMQRKTYGEIVAEILNIFFSANLSGWDVDLCIGRNTARIASVGGKTHIAEMWHNPSGALEFATQSLYERISGAEAADKPSHWFQIATQIAYIFAVYASLCQAGECIGGSLIDVSVAVGDMITPIAICYAQKMGLPVGTIIISSEKNSILWDLIHRAETNVTAAESTLVFGIEGLVSLKLGSTAVNQFVSSMEKNRTYFVEEELISILAEKLFCVVLSPNRSQQIMSSFNRTNHYILEPTSALCISGLQDFRAKTGVNNRTLILADITPAKHIDAVISATGLAEDTIMEQIIRR